MTETEKKYFDAKNDLIKAYHSISKLEPWQRDQLAKELLGVEAAVSMYNLMQKYSIGR